LNDSLRAPLFSTSVQILQHMSVPSELGLYVLGSYEDRVTIHSQQIRAFNLVFALQESGQLSGVTKVAVIGAGIAGLTAAVAAASLGATVHIYERHSEILHNLRGCHTRYLHPTVYDWPHEVSLKDKTELPFFNWEADTADRVAAKLLMEWNAWADDNDRVKLHLSADVTFHQCVDGKRRITNGAAVIDDTDFDIVILATGFGVETTVPPQPLRSYWRDDSLHQPEIEIRNGRTRYLVSGNGDGGLIDILRLRIRDFRHETLLAELCNDIDIAKLSKQLLEAEKYIQNEGVLKSDAGALILSSYKNLDIPTEILSGVEARLRGDTHVTFNYSHHQFTHRSSMLNRLLVFVLFNRDKALSVQPGKLLTLSGHEPNIEATFETSNGTRLGIFDRVVVRHGPHLAIARDFPACHATLGPVLKARNATDVTRKRIWQEWPTVFTPSGVAAAGPAVAETKDIGPNDSTHPSVVANRISELRVAMQKGKTDGLGDKLNLLGAEASTTLLLRLMALSEKNDDVLPEIKAMLHAGEFPAAIIERCVTNVVSDAVFSNSVRRKAYVLQLGGALLNKAPEPALRSLFMDVLRIVQNDQYTEVNVLVPALVLADEAVPDQLVWEYVETLLRHAQSGATNGAPAAQRGLAMLPPSMLKLIHDQITPATLVRAELRLGLQYLLGSPQAREIFHDKIGLINDFLSLGHKKFIEKHVPGYGETDA
jgi:hypothetical protein